MDYWVYILDCANNSYYTGYTSNLAERFKAHLNGSSKCKYTRSFKPLRIAQAWEIKGEKALAMQVECYLKKLTKLEKKAFVMHPEKLSVVFPQTLPASTELLRQT